MSLPDWFKAGWIAAHKTNRQEIADLLGIADRDLADCRAKGLSADWRLNIAYNAASHSGIATNWPSFHADRYAVGSVPIL